MSVTDPNINARHFTLSHIKAFLPTVGRIIGDFFSFGKFHFGHFCSARKKMFWKKCCSLVHSDVVPGQRWITLKKSSDGHFLERMYEFLTERKNVAFIETLSSRLSVWEGWIIWKFHDCKPTKRLMTVVTHQLSTRDYVVSYNCSLRLYSFLYMRGKGGWGRFDEI